MDKYLYHYTSQYHLPMIMNDQYLKLTESNLRFPQVGYKPVVWMTTESDITSDFEHGLDGSSVNKSVIKITIQCQKHYKYWKVWSRQNKISQQLAESLEDGRNANTWWISEKAIPFSEIVKIENRKNGKVYYENLALKK